MPVYRLVCRVLYEGELHNVFYFIFLLSDIKEQALEGFAFSIGISSCLCQIFCVTFTLDIINIVEKEERTQPMGGLKR